MYLLHIYRRMWFSGLCETLNFMTVVQTHREAGLTENEVLARVEENTGDIVVVTTTGVHLPCLGVWERITTTWHTYKQNMYIVSVAFGTVSPSEILMCPLVCPKQTMNLLDPPISTGSVHSSLIHRLLCGGGKKRGWYTLFAHAPRYLCNLHTTPPHQLLLSSLFVISPSFTQSVGSVEAIFYIGKVGMPHEFYGNWVCANSVHQLGSFFSAHAREPGNKANAHVEHSQLTIHKNCKIFTDINQMSASMMCY